jgi:hypothetical protein
VVVDRVYCHEHLRRSITEPKPAPSDAPDVHEQVDPAVVFGMRRESCPVVWLGQSLGRAEDADLLADVRERRSAEAKGHPLLAEPSR